MCEQTLTRNFWWWENILWDDDILRHPHLRGRVCVFLSERDFIIPSPQVQRYLARSDIDVHVWKDFDHAAFLTEKYAVKNVIDILERHCRMDRGDGWTTLPTNQNIANAAPLSPTRTQNTNAAQAYSTVVGAKKSNAHQQQKKHNKHKTNNKNGIVSGNGSTLNGKTLVKASVDPERDQVHV